MFTALIVSLGYLCSHEAVIKIYFYQLRFLEFDVNVLEAIVTFKEFQSDQIQRSSRQIFTAHYTCRNAHLNLTLVTGTTTGFIFQIVTSLTDSWGNA